MIKEMIFQLYNGYRELAGTGAVAVLFAISVLALILTVPAEKAKERALMALCVIPACAAAIAHFIGAAPGKETGKSAKARTVIAVCLAALAVASSGKSVISPEFTEKAENSVHIPPGVYEAMECILEDSNAPGVLVMPRWSAYFESYSPRFTVTGHEASNAGDEAVIAFELAKKSPDMRKVASAAHRQGCSYAVLPDDIWPDEPITKFGYELFAECQDCIVYKEVSPP